MQAIVIVTVNGTATPVRSYSANVSPTPSAHLEALLQAAQHEARWLGGADLPRVGWVRRLRAVVAWLLLGK